MNYRISKLLIIFSILVVSCKKVKKEEDFPMWNPNNSDITKWKEKALTEGDTNAYSNLSMDYMDSRYDGFLEIALTMANKYEYHLAYYDVYDCLTNVKREYGEHELKRLNNEKRKLAIEMLIKGAEKGNRECQRKLGELYLEGIYIEKNIEKGKKLIKESD